MLKSTWTYTAIGLIVIAAAGGAYHYIAHTQVEKHIPPTAESSQLATPSSSHNEDVRRKTLDDIGSIKSLKPVPMQPTPQR